MISTVGGIFSAITGTHEHIIMKLITVIDIFNVMSSKVKVTNDILKSARFFLLLGMLQYLIGAVASPAMGHWGTCTLLDF